MNDTSPDPASIGPFAVVRKLGEGAMGVVYEGFDLRLDRKVALKLVRRQLLGNPAVRERMTREAQAMARLSNPNVVQVYQVGEHDGGIYVAMEYVEGETLTGWLRAEARPWQLVLRTICEAGRGLAAAHAAGLVHRDFKPDNILVDAGGRARVLDFGLVHAGGADEPGRGEPPDDEITQTERGDRKAYQTQPMSPETGDVDRSNLLHWSVRLTQMGNVLGTPAYMSPEQHFGRPAGPYSDQFSFAITLYEALYGARPFGGDSWAAIRLQIQEGVVPPPPLESPVPRRVFKALARGLAIDPEQRWPSMAAMIASLEHDPWRVRLRVAAIAGLIGMASVASYVVAVAQVEGGQRCRVDRDQLAGVWDQARETAVTRAFEATHLPFSKDTAKRVKARIDGYAQAWVGERQAACEDRMSGAQTDRLADLRVACLDRRKAHLSALVDVFAAADNAVVENAVQAAAALPSLAACADADGLLAVVLPDDPAVAERVEALRRDLARADVFERTGRYEQGIALAAKIRADAVTLGYGPLEAAAALSEGRLLLSSVRAAEADGALLRAVQLGIEHDLHAIAAEAAIRRIFVVGNDLARPDEALAAAPFAEALVRRARGDELLGVLLSNNVGAVHDLRGDLEGARAHFERAIEGLRRLGASDPLEAIVHQNLGIMYFERGHTDAAYGHFVRSRDLFVAILGDGHPLVAHPLIGLGDVAVRRGRHVEARPHYLQALALVESSHGGEHRYLMYPLVGLGNAHRLAGQAEEASSYYARAIQLAEGAGIRDEDFGEALAGRAEIAVTSGSPGQARPLFERATAIYEEAAGKDSEQAAHAALRAGEVAAAQGEHEAAVGWFERVLANRPQGGEGPSRAHASLQLARLLARRGGGAGRVCALLEAGRAGVPESDPRRVETDDLFARSCAGR